MKKGAKYGGFTLIELLTVVVIIAILAGFLLSVLQKARETARKKRCQQEIREIVKAWQWYYREYGDFGGAGSTMDGTAVQILLGNNSKKMQFLSNIPPAAQTDGMKDPWGQVYRLNLSTRPLPNNTVTYVTKVYLVNKEALAHE